MGSLKRRLKNLEAALVSDECPVCGLKPGEPIVDYEVVWEDIYTEALPDESEKEPERCDGWDRQLEYIVVWDDVDPAGALASIPLKPGIPATTAPSQRSPSPMVAAVPAPLPTILVRSALFTSVAMDVQHRKKPQAVAPTVVRIPRPALTKQLQLGR
jgi:hypothetical protein